MKSSRRIIASRGCNCMCLPCQGGSHCRGSECYDLSPGALRAFFLLVLGLVLVLTGCATRTYGSYEEAAWAGAVCTDGGWVRVPDHYCPIGDEPVAGQQFYWRYRPYRDTDPNIDVVYVGYPVDRTVWVDRRPARVSTLHIDRGSFPAEPPAGVTGVSTAKVNTAPEKTRVQRGGLGVKDAPRSSVAVPNRAPAVRQAAPPPPAKSRPVAKAKTSPKGKK